MSEVLEVTDRSEFQDLLDTEDVVVVKFWATWCGPCKRFAPAFESAAERSDATFVSADVDKADWALSEFDVRGVPAVKVFKGGQYVTDVKEFRPVPFLNAVQSIT